MFPGEADAAEDLDAVLGAGVGGVERGAGGEGGDERADVGGLVHAVRGVPGERPGLFEADEHVGAEVFDALEASDGPAELLAHLGVFGGGVQRAGGGAAGVGGEEGAGQVPYQGCVQCEEPAGCDGDAAGPHLGGGAGRVGALVGADVQCGGVHGEPAGAVRGFGGEEHEVGLSGAEHGRRGAVEEVSAAFDGDGGHAAGPEGHRRGAPVEGRRPGPVQQYGGQRARQVPAGQRRPGGFLDHHGEVEEGAAVQVRGEQSGFGERVPVGGAGSGPGRGVEQFAHLLGRYGPRQPAAYRVGQFPLLLRDADAHTDPCRLLGVRAPWSPVRLEHVPF
ncbi:hypothetical protein EES37_02405 [Streptomyces sp. ADI91-18]|nr:hypothetical protein EES37_02405 [Streptomyces sp. ADI91-18]